ncbi:type II toxin-antitoxin system VapC family toxin [Komagataeibacter europaeus]|uniref:type II toxin-antitoxin system VapC family toxin n=1 Tax=Komagataeibacter europaeus TaxID=33995 RepID=UPI000B3EA230|nr:type II toxin-antitoxin system VapC family toxin [Komagataeibacter europaeus]ARW15965.1 hypothetical protein S101446_00825 [Komagataeibacter europaeus]
MRAVDTNIIVRYLTGDDPKQAEKARAVVNGELVFVPRTVVLETEWVLRGVYDMPKNRVIPALRAFAGLPTVTVEDATLVAQAFDWAEAGMDFADALHLAAAKSCSGFATFDRRFMRAATKVGTLSVSAP